MISLSDISCGDLFAGSTYSLNLQAVGRRASVGLTEKRDLAKSQIGNYDGLVNANPIPVDETCPRG